MNRHLKRTFRIAGPSVIEYILLTFVQIINTLMVSQLGKVSTAAVAINAPIMWFVNGSSVLTSLATTVLVSNAIGAKDREEALDTAKTGITMAFFYGVTLMIVILCLRHTYPTMMGAEPDVATLSAPYLFFYSLSLPIFVMGLTASGALKGCGNTKTPMQISFASNILLIILNSFFIYGTYTIDFANVPVLNKILSASLTIHGLGFGVKGAAISTLICQTLSGITLLIMVLRSNDLSVRLRHLFAPSKAKIKSILTLGWPAAAEKMALNLGQVAFQKIITMLGTAAVSAHYLVTTIESLCYMPAFGFSVATTALIGQAVGAREFDDAKIYAKQNIKLAFCIGVFGGVFYFFMPEQLLRLFTDEADVIAAGINSLKVIGIGECIYTAQIMMMGILQAGKETKPPFYSSLIGMWGIRLTLAYLIGVKLGFGLTGAWIALVIDLVIRFFYLLWHYKREIWIKKFM